MNVFNIFTGDAKTIYLKALNSTCDGLEPLDLTYIDSIAIFLPKADGTLLELAGEITGPAVLGKFSADISEEDSALLNVGQFQDFSVSFTGEATKFTVKYEGALSVSEVD